MYIFKDAYILFRFYKYNQPYYNLQTNIIKKKIEISFTKINL